MGNKCNLSEMTENKTKLVFPQFSPIGSDPIKEQHGLMMRWIGL